MSQSRRTFLGNLLSKTAGAWVALTGLSLTNTACKYGGPPPVEPKYGNPKPLDQPPDPAPPTPEPTAPTPEPSASPAPTAVGPAPTGSPLQPAPPGPTVVTKYGGTAPQPPPDMVAKYGGPRP